MPKYRTLTLALSLGGIFLLALFWGYGRSLARPLQQLGVGNQISYQGILEEAGNPAAGEFDFRFRLYDAPGGGNQVGSEVLIEDLQVLDGRFNAGLAFGDVWDGTAYYLEIDVRPGASGSSYETLTPRQPLTPAPYASFAGGAPWSGLAAVPAGFADDTDNDTLPSLSCLNGQIAKYDGSSWVCADDEIGASGGGDITGGQCWRWFAGRWGQR